MGEFLDVRRHGGLRWTIGVQDARRSELLHLVQEALRQFLATEADNGNGADGLDELRAIDPGLPLRRRRQSDSQRERSLIQDCMRFPQMR